MAVNQQNQSDEYRENKIPTQEDLKNQKAYSSIKNKYQKNKEFDRLIKISLVANSVSENQKFSNEITKKLTYKDNEHIEKNPIKIITFPLPKKKKSQTVNRSPHVYSRSKIKFNLISYKHCIYIYCLSKNMTKILGTLQKIPLPVDVDSRVEFPPMPKGGKSKFSNKY